MHFLGVGDPSRQYENDACHPINVADRDTDQGSDGPYRGAWDPEDGCLYLYLMYRQDGPRNGVNLLLQYGYEVFEPKE